MDYFLTYQLGIEKPSGKAANLGNAVHKSLELYAREKLAKQNNETSFIEPQSGNVFMVGDLTLHMALNFGWDMYLLPSFTNADKTLCRNMIEQTLNNSYSPTKNEIVMPEQYFDLEIPGDWAKYSYLNPHTGTMMEGQLRIKGTVDLLVRLMPNLLGYTDWKTGARIQWDNNRKPKDFDYLMHDPQMLLYYYALRRLYPQEAILMTIDFVKDGGPFTLPYGDEELDLALDLLKEMFEKIKKDKPDFRIMDDPKKNFPCKTFCYFGKNRFEDTNKTICDHFWGQLQELGTDRVTAKYGRPEVLKSYSDGGGMSNRDKDA